MKLSNVVIHVVFILLSLISNTTHGQEWMFEETGNAFDGFARLSGIFTEDGTLLVANDAESTSLSIGLGGDDSHLDHLTIKIGQGRIPANAREILMSFDNDRKYYECNFYGDKDYGILSAVSSDYQEFLNSVDIANMFKRKGKVNFRVISEDKIDISFPLQGATSAINKVFHVPNYEKAEGWQSASLEAMKFAGLITNVGPKGKNFLIASANITDYFEKRFGPLFFTRIDEIVVSDEDKKLIFKDSRGNILTEIPLAVALRNLTFFSCEPKDFKGKKKGNEQTLIYYHNYIKDFTDFSESSLSFSEFKELNIEGRRRLFENIKSNSKHLDYLRENKRCFYYYETEQYTFEVFDEAWFD